MSARALEEQGRNDFDTVLGAAGWIVQDFPAIEFSISTSVVLGERLPRDGSATVNLATKPRFNLN